MVRGVRTCIVPSCTKAMRRNEPLISYHKFPTTKIHSKVCTQWKNSLLPILPSNYTFANSDTLCSRHFDPGDFSFRELRGSRLWPTAVPTKHLEGKVPDEEITSLNHNRPEQGDEVEIKMEEDEFTHGIDPLGEVDNIFGNNVYTAVEECNADKDDVIKSSHDFGDDDGDSDDFCIIPVVQRIVKTQGFKRKRKILDSPPDLQSKSKNPQSQYKCPTCGKKLSSEPSFLHHVEFRHPFLCPKSNCLARFDCVESMDTHLQYTHPNYVAKNGIIRQQGIDEPSIGFGDGSSTMDEIIIDEEEEDIKIEDDDNFSDDNNSNDDQVIGDEDIMERPCSTDKNTNLPERYEMCGY